MAESEGRVIEEINLEDEVLEDDDVECLDLEVSEEPECVTVLDGTDCMDSSQESQDDIVDITPPPEMWVSLSLFYIYICWFIIYLKSRSHFQSKVSWNGMGNVSLRNLFFF